MFKCKIKRISLLLFSVFLFSSSPTLANEGMTATLPTYQVTMNEIAVDSLRSQYPILQYNNITYLPLTYYNAQILGLDCTFSVENGFAVNSKPQAFGQNSVHEYNNYCNSYKNANTYTVIYPSFALSLNGEIIQNMNLEYPFFIFRDIVYLPLTWEYAVNKLNLNYWFDTQTGLTIKTKPSEPLLDDSFHMNKNNTEDIQNNHNTATRVYVTGDVVNVRTGPGTDYDIVEQVYYNDELTISNSTVNENNELWYEIKSNPSKSRWIASWFVTINGQKSIGELTSIMLSEPLKDANKTIFAVKNGFGNFYDIEAVNDTSIRIILDNVFMNSELQSKYEDIAMSISNEGMGENQLCVTITHPFGTYVDIAQENEWLKFYCYKTHPQLDGSIIVLDPGHGGSDVGASGITMKYLTDADIGYSVSSKLKQLLENENASVFLTRSDLSTNEKVTLEERITFTHSIQPDLFISIHANSTEGITNATGAETYVYNGAIYPQQNLSENLAKHICNRLADTTKQKSVIKEKNLYVLRENNHPSVLIETGYLSNLKDEQLLSSDVYHQRLAEGIFLGIQQYFDQF